MEETLRLSRSALHSGSGKTGAGSLPNTLGHIAASSRCR
jgi:hypothetical protein